jgi:hypothetical protein
LRRVAVEMCDDVGIEAAENRGSDGPQRSGRARDRADAAAVGVDQSQSPPKARPGSGETRQTSPRAAQPARPRYTLAPRAHMVEACGPRSAGPSRAARPGPAKIQLKLRATHRERPKAVPGGEIGSSHAPRRGAGRALADTGPVLPCHSRLGPICAPPPAGCRLRAAVLRRPMWLKPRVSSERAWVGRGGVGGVGEARSQVVAAMHVSTHATETPSPGRFHHRAATDFQTSLLTRLSRP